MHVRSRLVHLDHAEYIKIGKQLPIETGNAGDGRFRHARVERSSRGGAGAGSHVLTLAPGPPGVRRWAQGASAGKFTHASLLK